MIKADDSHSLGVTGVLYKISIQIKKVKIFLMHFNLTESFWSQKQERTS